MERDLRKCRGHAAIAARQARPAQRASELRPHIAYPYVAIEAHAFDAAPRRTHPRRNERELAGKGLAQITASGQRRADIAPRRLRSEEHTSELQSLMRISYDVFCLTQKKHTNISAIYELTD